MSINDTVLTKNDITPRIVGLLLIPGFALFSYAAAVEPLRAANILSGRTLYRWLHLTPDGDASASSNGVAIAADRAVLEAAGLDVLLVCAGGNPAAYRDRATLRWLRSLGRQGLAIGGVSGGPYLLARAGLLDGRCCTIHWEHEASFAEAFPQLDLRRTLYEIDGNRMTCAGGVAALDMMSAMIERDHGAALGRRVSEWFLQTKRRQGGDAQRMSLRERTGVVSPAVLAALSAMEAHVEEPLGAAGLTTAAGVGYRQLERLFHTHLGETVSRRYRKIRLERARTLLAETAMPVMEVAAACGFTSASHFSRVFTAQFGKAPGRFRL
ncbi:HTH-type transcriptional regulator CdhR [Alphaproteobacteria bacterium SO-S41]|nr:HTH-type transcriptional regulator CdhR [Alphaproteobacteria bacterium SO-S41]